MATRSREGVQATAAIAAFSAPIRFVEYYEHGDQASAHVWWNLQGTFSGWEGRYYDNPDLRGGPALLRNDATLDFNWGEGAPVDWMPADQFSVVWTRNVTFSPGFYRLYVQSDDGVRVWLDDALIMDFWQPLNFERHQYDGAYLQGSHALKVEYFERSGLARLHFWWEPMGTTAPAVTPRPTSPAAAGLPGSWQAEYYNNIALTGGPALARTDAAINFNWAGRRPNRRSTVTTSPCAGQARSLSKPVAIASLVSPMMACGSTLTIA